MEQKNRAVAGRFAESLVGQMLQRSGADFYHEQLSPVGVADFLVQSGDAILAIKVKYLDDPTTVESVYGEWLSGVPDVAEATKEDPYPVHLVIVTGNGDKVFTDKTTAALLEPDQRTSLFILDRDAAAPARIAARAI